MSLFSRIKPQKTFHITIENVAKLLGISPKLIVRIEKWKYVLFVHRRDIGGQFLSYRRLKNWPNAVVSKIKNCYQEKQLLTLVLTIKNDGKKYAKQYQEDYFDFVKQAWLKQSLKVRSIMKSRGINTLQSEL